MKKSEEIEWLTAQLKLANSKLTRHREEQDREFWTAVNALKGGTYATLCVEGHFVPVLISDVEVSKDSTGLTDVMIKAYPQPPMLITEK